MSSPNIQVWIVKFKEDQVKNYLPLLTKDEEKSAKRFIQKRDRDKFVYRRGLTRFLIGEYLKTSPLNVDIIRNKQEKPYLPFKPFFFNTSFSHEFFLLAITKEGEIGVDIERVRKLTDFSSVANFVCTKSELSQLKDLEKNYEIFFQLWTQKEAFLKGLGTGLSIDPRFVQTPVPQSFGAIYHNQSKERWYVKSFTHQYKYYFSIAFKTKFDNISLFIRD